MTPEDQNTQQSPQPLPQPQTADQLNAEELRPYWLDPEKDYPEPHYFFDFNGVGFSPVGGLQAIAGPKKNGKTWLMTMLMSAALGTGQERIETYLQGLRARQSTIDFLGHPPVVLYADTEMEQLNTAKVLRRVHWLCGWDLKARTDRFHVLWLREVPKTETRSANHERWRLIKNAIEQVSPDIVFIDGLRDLVNNFNDLEESAAIVNEMMSLASQRNICIWNVLHFNPRPGNDDESKMRGHLGTELGNKVSDTFICTKRKAGDGSVTFTVKQQDARGKDVDDWKFEVTDDAGNLGIPKIYGGVPMPEQTEGDSVEDITAWINRAGETYEWPMSRSDIKKRVFGEIGGVTSHTRQAQDLKIAINLNLLVDSFMKRNGSTLMQPPEDMPF